MLTDAEKLKRYEGLLAYADDNKYALQGMDQIVERLTGVSVPPFVPRFPKENLERFHQPSRPTLSEFGGAG